MRRVVPVLGISAALAVTLLTAAGPSDAVGPPAPTGGLVLHYPMESLGGTTAKPTVADDSSSHLVGRVVNGTGTVKLAASLTGYGKALALTGAAHQFVDVPLSSVLDVDTYTLSAWVRYTGVQNDQTNERWEVLEKAGAYWMNVRIGGKVRVGGFYGGCSGPGVWQYFDSTVALPVGRWRHVASTYDGTWLRVFVDGRAAGAKRVSGRTCASGEPLAVGAKNNPTKGLLEAFWDGRLDDVRVYNRALTAAEVTQLATRP